MKRRLIKRGMIIEVHFWDHVEHGEKPFPFIVYGRVTESKRNYIVVVGWAHVNPEMDNDDNTTHWTILKSAITEWHELIRKEEIND